VATERRPTDYEQLASRYDEDRRHWRTAADVGLTQLFERGSEQVQLLDVGCGTGRHLATQVDCFGDRALRCFGVALSPAMLAFARAKTRREPGKLTTADSGAWTGSRRSFTSRGYRSP
jgi:SAM-dependent methyltransferase